MNIKSKSYETPKEAICKEFTEAVRFWWKIMLSKNTHYFSFGKRAWNLQSSYLRIYLAVNELIRYYPASFIMRSKDPSTLRIIDLWRFKSIKSNKRYIVEVEKFSNHFLGLKFYWKGVVNSKNRYSLLTNDYEPRTIVMSCVYIMLDYFRKDKFASLVSWQRVTWTVLKTVLRQINAFVFTDGWCSLFLVLKHLYRDTILKIQYTCLLIGTCWKMARCLSQK